ncbi:natterin-3-like [Poeciliopsis prolifica]|uniref:natterin-3-like n=1 Tax=Poeciliopsis prolifica TaxID=188132 RepID=UPI0024137C51|nr:natterin-3-like [Poeciliopsis prolifica]
MLRLLLLLVLASASLQVQPPDENGRRGNVSSLNLHPGDDVDKINSVSVSMVKRVLASLALKHKRPVNSSLPELGDTGLLRWEKWNGSLPNGSVSIYNSYFKRTDYICKVGCNSGFYNPSKGPCCHYPIKNEEKCSSSFQVLVNEDNFEIPVWKEGSYSSVPQNAVRTCSSELMYVGKNEYGLGKVDVKNQRFYLPREGKEYQYKTYEVLTRMMVEDEIITDVSYVITKAKIIKGLPTTLQSSTTTNRDHNPVKTTVSLTKTTTDERRWDISSSITVGVKTSITAGIPGIVGGNIEISSETTWTFSGGHTWAVQVSHSVSVELTVPPNHSCTVKMVGYQYKMDVPFTARINRTYEDGETRSVIISGNYHGVQVGDIEAVVDPCQPLSN